jgi:hypothetical protein
MCDLSSLVRLMIEKGLITEAEYCDAIIEGLRIEKAELTAELEAHYGTGTKVTLV